jgi:hypothetical protein
MKIGGKLALHYSELMKEVWLGNSSYVSPWELKKTIGRLASQVSLKRNFLLIIKKVCWLWTAGFTRTPLVFIGWLARRFE